MAILIHWPSPQALTLADFFSTLRYFVDQPAIVWQLKATFEDENKDNILSLRRLLASREYTTEEKLLQLDAVDFDNCGYAFQYLAGIWSTYFSEPIPLPEDDHLPFSESGMLRSKLGLARVELSFSMGYPRGFPVRTEFGAYHPPIQPLDPLFVDDLNYLQFQLDLTYNDYMHNVKLWENPPKVRDYFPARHLEPHPAAEDSEAHWYQYRFLLVPKDLHLLARRSAVFPPQLTDTMRLEMIIHSYPDLNFINDLPEEFGWRIKMRKLGAPLKNWLEAQGYLSNLPISLPDYYARAQRLVAGHCTTPK